MVKSHRGPVQRSLSSKMSAPEIILTVRPRRNPRSDNRGNMEIGEGSEMWLCMFKLWTHVSLSRLAQEDGLTRTNMRSAAKPWNPVLKAGSHGTDRARPLPAAPSGMKSSKSSTSLAFESRLSKVQTQMPPRGCWAPLGSPGRED